MRYGMRHATGDSLHEINDVEPQLCCQNDQKLTKILNFVTVPEKATCRTRMRTTARWWWGLGGVSPSPKNFCIFYFKMVSFCACLYGFLLSNRNRKLAN